MLTTMKHNTCCLLALTLFSIVLFSCQNKQETDSGRSLTVMTYNLENLFDNLDDPGKDDETYFSLKNKKTLEHKNKCAQLSRSYYKKQCLEMDWSDKKIAEKLLRVADVIKQINNGSGPDILIVEEVENTKIMERLRLQYLKKQGYKKTILIDGPDQRGIDVAILSKLPLSEAPKLNAISLEKIKSIQQKMKKNKNWKPRPTRGILQARFKLFDNSDLTVFAVHFPSQGAPTPFRKRAVQRLNQLRAQLPASEYVIAAGDFNITKKEDLKTGLFSKDLSKHWFVSHQVGCKNCEGTHFYRGKWSFLDAILFSKNFQGEKWKMDPKKIRVIKKSRYQLKNNGSPARFNNGETQKGVSDHLPIAAEINYLGM